MGKSTKSNVIEIKVDKITDPASTQAVVDAIQAGFTQKVVEDADTDVQKLINQVRLNDSSVAFVNANKRGIITTATGTASNPVSLLVGVTAGTGTVDLFADDVDVIISTTASNVTITPSTGTVSDGVLAVSVTSTTAQEFTLNLTNDAQLINGSITITIS